MGAIVDIIKDSLDPEMVKEQREAFSGRAGANAALEGAAAQERTSNRAIDLQESFLNDLQQRTNPFLQFGSSNINNLQSALGESNPLLSRINYLASNGVDRRYKTGIDNAALNPQRNAQLDRLNELSTDPNAQANFVSNNPFFNALAKQAQDNILNIQAAKGKLGSSGTLEALQDSRLRLGSQFLNQELGNLRAGAGLNEQIQGNQFNRLLSGANVGNTEFNNLLSAAGVNSNDNQIRTNNLFRAISSGQNAAAFQGAAGQQTGNQITNLLTGIGNAQAAGGIGAANSLAQGSNNIASIVGAFLCDKRFKQNIKEVGEFKSDRGYKYKTYEFNYVNSKDRVVSVMAQDVEKINPDAVFSFHGVKYVNSAKL